MAIVSASAEDMRDVPKCLRAVRLTPWRDAPTANGDSVCYGTFEPGKARTGDPQWFEVEPATGSDYSGGIVTLANQRELKRLLTECEASDLPCCMLVHRVRRARHLWFIRHLRCVAPRNPRSYSGHWTTIPA